MNKQSCNQILLHSATLNVPITSIPAHNWTYPHSKQFQFKKVLPFLTIKGLAQVSLVFELTCNEKGS